MSAPVIAPVSPIARHGKSVQHFTSDQDVTWTKLGGTFSGTAARAVDWTAPNVGGSYTVTATNGSAEATTITITVTGVVPFMPNWGFEPEDGKKVLVFDPDQGDRQTRTKGEESTFPFIRNGCQNAELTEIRAFHAAHYPGKKVYFTPPDESESLWWIDSKFKYQRNRTNLANYSFVLRKA